MSEAAPAGGAEPTDGVTRRPALSDGAVLLVVGVLTAGAHLLATGLGLRIHNWDLRPSSLSTIWQLLPPSLLRHDLVGSLAHLHSQPPLYNVATGLLLQLPTSVQPWVATAFMVLCAVVLAVAAAGMMLELGVNKVAVLVVVLVFVAADPAQYLYAEIYFYALPTAALVTATGWAAVHWARTARVLPGVAYGVLAAALILTNSSYQLYTVALATVPLCYVLRRSWRQIVVVLIGPLLVVVAWYANDVVQFGTATTSSWVGMNLARATLALDSHRDLRLLVREGVVSRTALVQPFDPLTSYGALGRAAPTGHAALDIPWNINNPNFNNEAYLAISSRYLHDDLQWIVHRPWHYLTNTTIGLRLWMMPAEQYYELVRLGPYQMAGYTNDYDRVVGLQPTADPYAVFGVVLGHYGPGWSNLSITAIVETVLAILVLPFVAWRRRLRDPRGAAGALWVWVLCASVFVTTTLLEAAENNRFRFELGGLLLVAATASVAWLVQRQPSVAGSSAGLVENETDEPGRLSPSTTNLHV